MRAYGRGMETLAGTWRLVDWTFSVDGSRPIRPWGGDQRGLLVYADDGYMAVTLMSPDRPDAPTATLSSAPASVRATAAAGYLSYSGTYSFDGDDVLHHIEVSLLPNWVGTTERRHVSWDSVDGDLRLVLSTPPATTDGGRTAVNRLVWRRAAITKNPGGWPPPHRPDP